MTSTGSSPRVRGKPALDAGGHAQERLIPARAGKTGMSPTSSGGWRAHPRACGENVGLANRKYEGEGSSPRVRGKRVQVIHHTLVEGLIPARAGKTLRHSNPLLRPRAHPRACGENLSRPRGWGKSPGSSPRVRGKLSPDEPGEPRRRLIPARAGKTPMTPRPPCTGPAHPRACGENACGPATRTA